VRWRRSACTGSTGRPTRRSSASFTGINNAGQIVGAYQAESRLRAFLYEHGTFTLLDFYYAADINDLGEIVGYQPAAALTHGIVADVAGVRPFDVPGATQTIASGIDNAGRIVGGSSNYSFLYSGGTVTPIDVPGLRALRVLGTNDVGQIVGTATDAATSRAVAFLATPVTVTATPEPATWTLVGAGLLAIGGVSRRRPRA
jgi:probable HAF family extracellular repeat protein